MKESRPSFHDWLILTWAQDADVCLMHYRSFWQDSGNPYYVWIAIDVCTKHNRDFPDWVRSYLAQCSQRMMDAAEPTASKDLRKILPGVLGFAVKRGRGHPLRPDGDEHEYVFAAFRFAGEIAKGCKPSDALRNASTELDRSLADKIDDKTLLSHIKKHFGIKNAPRTNAEWKKLIRAWCFETYGRLAKEYREWSP